MYINEFNRQNTRFFFFKKICIQFCGSKRIYTAIESFRLHLNGNDAMVLYTNRKVFFSQEKLDGVFFPLFSFAQLCKIRDVKVI